MTEKQAGFAIRQDAAPTLPSFSASHLKIQNKLYDEFKDGLFLTPYGPYHSIPILNQTGSATRGISIR
jgi:hypothetical protein